MSAMPAAPRLSDTDTIVDEPGLDARTDSSHGDPGDHDRYSHYVRKDAILPSAVEGTPVIALCGKKWVPNRNPDGFTICPECKEIYESLR